MIYDEVRIAYLSARERPKEYEDEWANIIDKLRQKWDGTGKLGDLMRDRMDENLLFSEKAKDAGGGKARICVTMLILPKTHLEKSMVIN